MKALPFLISLICLSLSFPAMSQQTKILTAEKHNEYGLVYSLPVTSLQITVTARKKTSIAGPFYQYAKKYIGTDRVVSESSSSWEIVSIDVNPYGIADNGTQYIMQLKAGSPTFMEVADDGMLLSINAPTKRTTAPVVRKSVTNEPPHSSGKEYLKYVDADFLASQSKAKQAEMLSESLMEARDSYLSLTRGTADNMPSDGKQLELMLKSLKEQEQAITEAFTGSSYVSEVTRTFTYTPGEQGRAILFRLSDFDGFVNSNDFSGEPIYIRTKIVREGQLPTDANGVEKKYPKDGVAYSIPGTAKITISFRGEELFSENFEFAQYGTVFALNPSLFSSKKDPSYAIFSDVTGGLLEIGSVSKLEESLNNIPTRVSEVEENNESSTLDEETEEDAAEDATEDSEEVVEEEEEEVSEVEE